MNNFFRRYFKGDPIIWTIYLLLCVVSIVAVFSASSDAIGGSGRAAGQILRHVAFIAVGFGTLLAVYSLPLRIFLFHTAIFLYCAIGLLATGGFYASGSGSQSGRTVPTI